MLGAVLLACAHTTSKVALLLPRYAMKATVPPKVDLSEEGPQSVLALSHGTFFFWRSRDQATRPHNRSEEPAWTEEQTRLLDDEDIDVDRERARCAAYGFGLPNGTVTTRRRLFLGSLIADDSLEVLKAVGTEAWNIFDTVSFVESNITQNFSPRRWRYLASDRPSQEAVALQGLFGPRTKVKTTRCVRRCR